MKRSALLIFLFAILVVSCSPGSGLPTLNRLPDFTLTERSGRTVTLEELEGQVWVADFIFTQCAGVCLAMSSNMSRLQTELPAEVRLVSFSVDPANDTPEVLSAYAKRYNADASRWLFLTGDQATIHRLSIEGFKLAVETAGTEVEPIMHSSRFVLLDRNARVRGYYSMEDEGAFERLVADARKLL